MQFSLRALFRNTSYIASSNIFVSVLAFLQGVIVTRTLGPSLYGVWGVIVSFTGLIQSFSSFRTTEALTRYMVQYRLNNDLKSLRLLFITVLMVDLGTGILAYVLIIALVPWVSKSIAGGNDAISIYYLYGFTVILNFSNNLWFSVARDQKRYLLMALLNISSSLLQIILVIVLWYFKSLTVFYLAAVYLVVKAMNSLVNVYFLQMTITKGYHIKMMQFKWNELIAHQKEFAGFWRFMKITYLSSMVSTLVKNSDIMILGYFRPDNEVGWYRLGKSLISMMQQLISKLAVVAYQDFNELIAAHKFRELRKGIYRLLKIWTPMVISASVIMMLAIGPLIRAVYGVNFSTTAVLVKILLVSVVVTAILFWVQPAMLALDGLKENLVVSTIIGIISLVMMTLMTSFYGSYGIAWTVSCSWITGYVGMVAIVALKYRQKAGI